MSQVTRILQSIDGGDPKAAEELLPLVYAELRKLAAAKMAQEKPGQTLQATALVHEAYLRLVERGNGQQWNGRAHFFAAAAETMRRILVERARAKLRKKRGGGLIRLEIDEFDSPAGANPQLVLAVNDALEQLAAEDERLAALVKLRCFAGLTLTEAADALGVARSTSIEDWAYAKSRLRTLLGSEVSS